MSDLKRVTSSAVVARSTNDDTLVLHLPEGSGRFSAQALQTVQAGYDDAVHLVMPVLNVGGVDVAAIDAPGMAIPGWGCGGYTYGQHSILLALDPEDEGFTVDHVRATIVHELHHVARERGPGCGTSLRERIVSEGLAMLFEEQVLGRASEFAHQDIGHDDITRAVAALDEDPANDGLWFFHAGDLPLWFGYSLGYRWARAYAAAHGTTASDLAHTPAIAIAEQGQCSSG